MRAPEMRVELVSGAAWIKENPIEIRGFNKNHGLAGRISLLVIISQVWGSFAGTNDD